MKEAIGNSYVFGIIIALVGVIFLILIGSLSYSKAFKIKTKMIDIIEKHEKYNNDEVRDEIDNFLKETGYIVSKTSDSGICPKVNGNEAINTIKNYDYCVYRFDTVKGPYYRVTVFISFDFPLISTYLRIPLSGETRLFYDL